jgi:arylsulfatase
MDTVTTVNGREVTDAGTLNGLTVGPGVVPISAPLAFTANETFDIGRDQSSPVSLDYYDVAPFKFNGKVERARVEYTK